MTYEASFNLRACFNIDIYGDFLSFTSNYTHFFYRAASLMCVYFLASLSLQYFALLCWADWFLT